MSRAAGETYRLHMSATVPESRRPASPRRAAWIQAVDPRAAPMPAHAGARARLASRLRASVACHASWPISQPFFASLSSHSNHSSSASPECPSERKDLTAHLLDGTSLGSGRRLKAPVGYKHSVPATPCLRRGPISNSNNGSNSGNSKNGRNGPAPLVGFGRLRAVADTVGADDCTRSTAQ